MGNDVYRYEINPKKDNWGRIGTSERRWHEIYAVNLYTNPQSYSSDPMTGNETFTDSGTADKLFFLNANGTNRNFNPSGTFRAGFKAYVKNIGTSGNITFDSTASKQVVFPGQLGILLYDGTTWR
uniref:Uncharacterized protein n=1 Tax=viral metagenome TaxID=1070528 RepID=A0A6M3KWW3_9ZZZZ